MRESWSVILFLGLLCALPASSAFGKQQPLNSRPKLTFSTFPSEGMGVLFKRILTEAYGRIGYDVAIEGVPAERALVMSNQGLVDGEAARVPVVEPACPNLIRVPTPLYTNRVVAFAKKEGVDVTNGWKSLFPYSIGSVRGYKYIEKQTSHMNRVLVSCYQRLLNLLINDRLDVVVAEYFDVLPTLKEMQPKNIRMLEPPLAYNPMYHYLHKRHADLVPRIDKVLHDMHSEGRMLAIQREMENERGRPACLSGCVVPLEQPAR